MDLKTFHLTLVLSLFCFFSLTAPKALAQIEGNNPVVHDAINDAYIVGGSGVVGAVLGLSTLSFVEKPGDHLRNIVVGGAIGIIIGVSVVAWGQANKSRQNMTTGLLSSPPEGFSTTGRYAWHYRKTPRPSQERPSFQYRFEF